MAKLTGKSSGSSKIRFILLEADLAEGDLDQVTQAITNALRPTAGSVRMIAKPVAANGARNPVVEDETVAEEAGQQDDTSDETSDYQPARPAKPRKYPPPTVLTDVDLNSGDTPFEKFATQKAPTKNLERYLCVAFWFKTFRGVEAISRDHVYTCYKKMGWGTNIKDFTQPLRDLGVAGRGSFKDGTFTINHIGEDVIDKLNK